MSDILIQSSRMKECEEINLGKNETKVIYQDFDTKINCMNITLAENSNLEILLYNSSVSLNANLGTNASLKIYNLAFVNEDYKCNLEINLNDEASNVNIINVYLGINDANLESNIQMNHLAKHSVSMLETYAIGKNNAKLNLNNNAFIKQGMSQSDAKQSTRGLNLSTSSSIKAQPNLFIDEYDVIASHSCSIGSIDKDDLFYLMSRGLPEDQAHEIVVLGFIQPIIEKIKNENLQEVIYKKFANLLK
jgi:Fe-S cluster assembly protein SufD